MFDFRYHVVSLAAVFFALVLGILIGVGISGRGFVEEAERDRLNQVIDELRAERDTAREENDGLRTTGGAAASFVQEAYPLVMSGRLSGRTIAVVSVGPIPQALDRSIRRALTDAGGVLLRRVVLRVPNEVETLESALERFQELSGDELGYGRFGTTIGAELVNGESELLASMTPVLVVERTGTADERADGVIFVAPPPPRLESDRGEFVRGLYGGVAGSTTGVAVEELAVRPSAVVELATFGFATVDNADTPLGRVAIVAALLGGVASEGSRYGVKAAATEGPLPSLEPLATPGG